MPRYSSFGRFDNQQVDDGDTVFQRINSRLRPDQLKAGEVALSENGRMDVDGAWQVRKGISVFGAPITNGTTALTLPFTLYANRTIASATRSVTLVTVTTTAAHGFTSNTLVSIVGLNGTLATASNRLITSTGSTTFTFVMPGLTGSETYGGSGVAGAPILDDSAINNVYGSCLFSDPASNSSEYIILATNTKARLFKLSDTSSIEIAYPLAIALSANVNLIQAFNYVFIFRDGLTALQWDGNLNIIPGAFEVGKKYTILTLGANPQFTTIGAASNTVGVVFTATGTGTGTGTAASSFTLVENGDYTQPTIFQGAGNAVIASGIVTITANAHNVEVGDFVRISDKGTTGLNSLEQYVVYETTVNTFKFKADAPNTSSPATVAVGKRQSIGLGFTHMPCPEYAIYHQRRLFMPFKFLSTGSSGSPTITARNVADEIIVSDILDQNTYDQIQNQFRIASGGADYTVALQPFAEDNLIVFNRNSIHLISGIGVDLGNAVVREITREVGCCSRKSIAQVGNKIMFLSDNGVYGIEFDDLYNLRGVSVPLSEAINPIIEDIDPTLVTNAVGVYHNNRYYLAYTAKGQTANNKMMVYNFLNAGWESIDVVNQQGWNIREFFRAGAGGINSLYAITEFGGIHLIDSGIAAVDTLALDIGGASTTHSIEAALTTRQYTFGTMDRKKFNSYEVHMESSPDMESNLAISLETENLDGNQSYGSLGIVASGDDASFRGRLGNKRAYGAQFSVSQTVGRPKVRAVKITGMLAFSSTTSAS
jgi:hypothetical protein